jgi:hypothetical protein
VSGMPGVSRVLMASGVSMVSGVSALITGNYQSILQSSGF